MALAFLFMTAYLLTFLVPDIEGKHSRPISAEAYAGLFGVRIGGAGPIELRWT